MSFHEPGDVVRMMDKGIAVQPGLRTLFQLHYLQVIHQIELSWFFLFAFIHFTLLIVLKPI